MCIYEAFQHARLQRLERCAPILSAVDVGAHFVKGVRIVCGHLRLRLQPDTARQTCCRASDGGPLQLLLSNTIIGFKILTLHKLQSAP